MADTVRSVEYQYATVPDAPGEVQRILSALQERGVNLVAFLGFPEGGQSQIDLVAEDPQALRDAARRQASRSATPSARSCPGRRSRRRVADATGKLAEANVNVTAAAAVAAGSGSYGMIVWVAQADYDRAASALGV